MPFPIEAYHPDTALYMSEKDKDTNSDRAASPKPDSPPSTTRQLQQQYDMLERHMQQDVAHLQKQLAMAADREKNATQKLRNLEARIHNESRQHQRASQDQHSNV